MKYLLGILLVIGAASAHADVFKCVVNGKTQFSDQPCAGAAQKIEVRPASGEANAERAAAAIANTKKNGRKADLDGQISRAESEIAALNRDKEAKLSELRTRKRYANNNLAGATLEQSISTEMQAVASDYNARIDQAMKELERAKAERASLDKPDPK